jgi:hypothetical protein
MMIEFSTADCLDRTDRKTLNRNSPQRHRDTEESQNGEELKNIRRVKSIADAKETAESGFSNSNVVLLLLSSVPLCLCGENRLGPESQMSM